MNLQHFRDEKTTAFWKDGIRKGGFWSFVGFIMMLGYVPIEKWAVSASVVKDPQGLMALYSLWELLFGVFGCIMLTSGLAYFAFVFISTKVKN